MNDEKTFVHAFSAQHVAFEGFKALYSLLPTGLVQTFPMGAKTRSIGTREAYRTIRRKHEEYLIDLEQKRMHFFAHQVTPYTAETLDRRSEGIELLFGERSKKEFAHRFKELRAAYTTQEGIVALTESFDIPQATHYIVSHLSYHHDEPIAEMQVPLACFHKDITKEAVATCVQEQGSFPYKVHVTTLPATPLVLDVFKLLPYQKLKFISGAPAIRWRNEQHIE